jgi:hypothetical protein
MKLDRFYCHQCEIWIEFEEDLCLECYKDQEAEDHDGDDYSYED